MVAHLKKFKNDVTALFLKEICKEFVTDYEFVKVNDHESHLLMNCKDLEKLGVEMESPFAKEWDKKIIVRILSIQLNFLDDMKRLILSPLFKQLKKAHLFHHLIKIHSLFKMLKR